MNQFAVQPNSCGGIWIPGAAEVLGIERRSYLDALLEVDQQPDGANMGKRLRAVELHAGKPYRNQRCRVEWHADGDYEDRSTMSGVYKGAKIVKLASFAPSSDDDANVRYVGLQIAHCLGRRILPLCNVTEFSWL